MGLLRFFLAACVISTHSAYLFGVPILDGNTAIEVFYIISGFLITMVINLTYKNRRFDFYLNRLTKIYPAYFAALVFSFGWFSLIYNSHHNPFTTFKNMNWDNPLDWVYAFVTNVMILGSDTSRYTSVQNDGSLSFFDFSHTNGSGGHNLLFVPQSWTVSIELLFYFLAPFIVFNRSRLTLLIMLGSSVLIELVGQYFFQENSIRIDSESISIFQMKYFLIGALAATFIKIDKNAQHFLFRRRVNYTFQVILAIAVVCLSYQLHLDYFLKILFFTCFAIIFLPVLFRSSARNSFDKYVGNLSYPLYIFHYPIAKTLDRWTSGTIYFIVTLLLTLLISILFQLLYNRYVESFREGIRHGR